MHVRPVEMAGAMRTIFYVVPMTHEQRAAHLRLLATLPVRTVAEDPDRWDENDRQLSPEEMPYLHEGNA